MESLHSSERDEESTTDCKVHMCQRPLFRGCLVLASMEGGPEDVSLLERCPLFRGCFVLASMEVGPEDVSLLERCPHFRWCYVRLQVPVT